MAAIFALPAISAAQRMAPLPPPCALPGSTLPSVATRPGQLTLAVLPLAIGSGAGAVGYLSNGLADEIAQRIVSSMPKIDVLEHRAQRRTSPSDLAAIRG